MKTKLLRNPLPSNGEASRPLRLRAFAALGAMVCSFAQMQAAPTVATLTGGPWQDHPPYFGYVDGDTASVAQFNTPYGLALDSTGNNLYVADRDNNAIRFLQGVNNAGGQTFTFTTQWINQPVGVAVDSGDNVYVLNRGNGNNGNVLKFDTYGDFISTNAVALTNATGIALDGAGNIYLAVRSNTLMRVSPAGVTTNIATIAIANTSLQGIVVKHNGLIAACDAGRHGIYLIDPNTGVVTTNAGFHGAGDFINANNMASSTTAKFNKPYGVTEAGDGTLVVADFGNHRVKVVLTTGVVTNLYGVSSNFWYGPLNPSQGVFPGWYDGTVSAPDYIGGVEARQPVGVVFAPDGSVYATETYYHLIRKVTSTGLPQPPPPPPQVPAPLIGWVDFPYPNFLSLLHPGTSFVFNNDVVLAIQGTNGSQTFFTSGETPTTGSIPDPSPSNGSTPPSYQDNLPNNQVVDLPVTRFPDMTIKAIGTKIDGSPKSVVVQARIQFVTGNPIIVGNNPAAFTVTNQTVGAEMWYTLNGLDPTNDVAINGSIGPLSIGAALSLDGSTNINFKIRAFRANYQPSGVVTTLFSTNSFIPNSITFGFAAGEASSDFIASPGQLFYAPVTLAVLPTTRMYSLQFNLTVTNLAAAPPVPSGGFRFESMLEKPDPSFPSFYHKIPPAMFVNYTTNIFFNGTSLVTNLVPNFTNLLFSSQNLLGVGWLERNWVLGTNLYNTQVQDLIKYSQAHDTLFDENNGKVIAGGYGFRVPGGAVPGDQYKIQIGRPSATSDGVGAPGSDVFISTPTNGSLAGGAINSIKHVTVGQRKYIVGDAAPFRWFNAGDFGNSNLLSDDVMQVFQSAIYNLNYPPPGSDFFDAMDSCCGTFQPQAGTDYLVPNGGSSPTNLLFAADDISINNIAFGDTNLDVSDIFVTFRRSLDPSLTWFRRFWTNDYPGVRVAQAYPAPFAVPLPAPPNPAGPSPEVKFTAGDGVVAAGQTVYVPISASIHGNYPLRVLALGLTVEPLDGAPPITAQVQFSPGGGLGSPTISSSRSAANYSAAWLNNTIAGLTGDAQLGYLQITLPANCPINAAYAIVFDHASGSPNGISSFPNKVGTGLVTLRDRSASSLNDGISDAWRLRYFGTLNNILSLPNADADGDGANNLHEFKAGTNPNDASSVLRVATKKGLAPDLGIQWPSISGKQYVIERSSSLYSPAWTSISTNTGTGWDMEYHDTSAGTGSRFYRVRVQ